MFPEIERVLIDEGRIAARVHALGRQIAADLLADTDRSGADQGSGGGGEIVLIPILTGSIVFVADLIRQLPLKLSLGVVAVSSYPGKCMQSKGAAIKGELPPDLRGKHVLVVDDILDSGRTLGLVRRLIAEQNPASLRIAVLLRKVFNGGKGGEGGRAEETPVDYVGFDIPDEFVVGYGLDYDGYYRNYPAIAVLRQPS
jgi:hypoxanthine phosphoribosyltransferase